MKLSKVKGFPKKRAIRPGERNRSARLYNQALKEIGNLEIGLDKKKVAKIPVINPKVQIFVKGSISIGDFWGLPEAITQEFEKGELCR